jgi:hypothetical protein
LQVENAFANQNTGLQLRRINRLGQIVIGSSFHRGKQQILLAILASQHDGVNVTSVSAERPAVPSLEGMGGEQFRSRQNRKTMPAE